MDFAKAERIAALLDGKCSEQEREELLAQLAADGDGVEAFGTAAAALREHEEEERTSGVTPLRPPAPAPVGRRPLKPPRWVPLAAAAGLAAIIAVPLLKPLLQRGTEDASAQAAVVAMLTHPEAGLPAGVEAPQWSAPRGAEERMDQPRRVQLGVKLVELELFARSGKVDRARTTAGEVAALLETEPAAGATAADYRRIRDGRASATELDPELGARAAKVGGAWTEVGAWLEGALVAVARHDTHFFSEPRSQEVLHGRGPGERLKQIGPGELEAAREALAGASPRWDVLRTAIHDLLLAST